MRARRLPPDPYSTRGCHPICVGAVAPTWEQVREVESRRWRGSDEGQEDLGEEDGGGSEEEGRVIRDR